MIRNKKLLALGIVFVFILSCACSRHEMGQDASETIEEEMDDEELEEESEEEKSDDEEELEEESDDEELEEEPEKESDDEELEEEPEEESDGEDSDARQEELYIAVPVDYMSMRQKPGYGKDIVTKIYAETKLRMVGETVELDGKKFYRMQTLDGAYEGYCSADYCVKVSYDYGQEDTLTIVDTDNAIYSYEDMEEDLKEIASQYPEYVSLETIGQSVEGRNIYMAVLGNPKAPKKIFIQAGIHGREYISCQHVMKMLEYYAANYGTGYYEDTQYSELLENVALHIVPMSNPDGVMISQLGEDAVSSEERIAMMRSAYERDKQTLIHMKEPDEDGNLFWYDTYKDPNYDRHAQGYDEIISYEEYLTLWKANANGVDINRNFGVGWEAIVQKQEPGCEFFKGYASDSEPETIALENQIMENEYAAILNYHAKGQVIYYDAAGNTGQMSEKSERLANIVGDLNRYRLVNNQDASDVVLGGLGDWAMLNQNTVSITIEMGKKPCPVGSEEFASIWHRGREVWAKVMQAE